MKIAGRKNDGAWFRTNVWLKNLTGDDRAALKAKLIPIATLSACLLKIQQLATAAGVSITDSPTTADDFIESFMSHGVPRQIWLGKPTFSKYTRSGAKGSYTYTQDGAKEFAQFGRDLRKAFKLFQFANRQVRDVFNLGALGEQNPGGYPDVDKTV